MTPLHPRITLAALCTALASSATTFAATISPHCALGTHTDAVVACAAIVSAISTGIAALGRPIVSAPMKNSSKSKQKLVGDVQSLTPQAFPQQPDIAPVQFPIPVSAATTGKKEQITMGNFLEEVNAVEKAGVAIISDVEAFAAGQLIAVPPIPLSSNANGKTELILSLQKVSAPVPFPSGSVFSLIGTLLIEEISGAPVVVPTFTERIGNTIVAISASVQRVPVAAPAVTSTPPPTSEGSASGVPAQVAA